MAFRAAEARREKRPDQFPGERMADHKAPQTNHVHVVVLDALMR